MGRSKELIRYCTTRLALLPVMLWMIATLVFILLRVAPGDPIDAILGTRATELARELLREKLGLNLSITNQYISFMRDLSQGNLGESLVNQEPVNSIVRNSLPATIELGIFSIVIAALLGLIIGFMGASKPESNTDIAGRIYGIGTYAIPPFWAAMIAQLIFAVILGWLPIGGRFPPRLAQPDITGFLILDSIIDKNLPALMGTIKHLVLPSFTLGILLSGIFSRSLRLNLIKVLDSSYIEAARSRGIKEKDVLIKHALPNSLLPVLTIIGITIASLIGGALLIEVTFSWPGIALRLQEAISQRDYTVVQGITIVVAFLIVIISVIVDLIIAIIDPRVSF
tara:strand:+ start:181 stop:1200 length:1020 start_codon:yes stop_codon:yes gene_type:complete